MDPTGTGTRTDTASVPIVTITPSLYSAAPPLANADADVDIGAAAFCGGGGAGSKGGRRQIWSQARVRAVAKAGLQSIRWKDGGATSLIIIPPSSPDPPKANPNTALSENYGRDGDSTERGAVSLAHVPLIPLTLTSTLSPEDRDLGMGFGTELLTFKSGSGATSKE